MSESYSREEQNNALLSSLSQKTSALKHVTLNIYDNAEGQHSMLDRTDEVFGNLGSGLKGSVGRLGRMAKSGDRVAVLKVAGIIVVVVALAWWILGWIFGG